MADKSVSRKALISTRWVHVFEEDTENGAVYKPDSADIPLSRRPREQLELAADGGAVVFVPGPGDRLTVCQGTWTDEAGTVVVRTKPTRARAPAELRIVEASASRLIVQD